MPRAPVAESGDAFREEALRAARAFKASWTGLARVLTRVRDEGLWGNWGFPSFEAYCTRELRIRKATALKLTPDSPIAHVEHGNVLLLLYGEKKEDAAAGAFEKAGKLKPKDAMEALDAAYAKSQLE